MVGEEKKERHNVFRQKRNGIFFHSLLLSVSSSLSVMYSKSLILILLISIVSAELVRRAPIDYLNTEPRSGYRAMDIVSELILVLFGVALLACCFSCCFALLSSKPTPPPAGQHPHPQTDPCMNHCHIPVCSCQDHEFSRHCLVHGAGMCTPLSPELRPPTASPSCRCNDSKCRLHFDCPGGKEHLHGSEVTVWDDTADSLEDPFPYLGPLDPSEEKVPVESYESSTLSVDSSDSSPDFSPYHETPPSDQTILHQRSESVEAAGKDYKPPVRVVEQAAASPSSTVSSSISITMVMSPPSCQTIASSPPGSGWDPHLQMGQQPTHELVTAPDSSAPPPVSQPTAVAPLMITAPLVAVAVSENASASHGGKGEAQKDLHGEGSASASPAGASGEQKAVPKVD